MHNRICTVLWGLLALFTVSPSFAAEGPDEEAVKTAVERFLSAVGTGDYEALPAMFAPRATISHPAKVGDTWTMINETFDEWFAARMANPTRPRFREPVNAFTVHVDGGLAVVRADASYFVEDQLRSNNLDYFTLIKVDGTWKFVNASFVIRPVPVQ